MNYEQWLKTIQEDASESIKQGVPEGAIRENMFSRTKELFPDVTQDVIIQAIKEAIEKAFKGIPSHTINVNIANSFNNSALYINTAPVYKKSEQVKLNYRLLRDDRLTLADRIIFSYLWKWNWLNWKRTTAKTPKAAKPITLRRCRKATGFRHSTVRTSVMRLRGFGLVDGELRPFPKDKRYMGFRKLTWNRNTMCIRINVFGAMMASSKGQYNAGWWTKVLGISKKTFYRWRKGVGTDDTKKGTDDTQSGNG